MEEKNNSLLVIGVILSVLFPPVGIVICLIELNDIKKNNREGKNLAVNGIMVGVLVLIVWIIAAVGLTIYHNHREEEQEQREKYQRELKKVCENLGPDGIYDSYDKDHPNKKFIQCRNGDCYMYKNGQTLESIDCDLGF